jgi:hypothetical protein
MRSDEILDRVREKAVLGTVASWPDWPDARLLNIVTERHQSLMSNEIVTAAAGYGQQDGFVTCTAGVDLYPTPDRAVGSTLIAAWLQQPGEVHWTPLERVELRDAFIYDRGPADTNKPRNFLVTDGFIELYPSPSAAFTLRYRFYIRPSSIVTSQSSALVGAGDAVVRGLITAVNKVARTITVNALPFDQSLAPPAAITSAVQQVDIIHAAGNYTLAMYSQPQTLSGLVLTLGGTDDMTRVRVGDWVRVAEQSDWPINLPHEFHRMLCDRSAMEVLGATGRAEDASVLGLTVKADLDRFRSEIRPQVKTQPRMIPCVPISARGGRSRRWGGIYS